MLLYISIIWLRLLFDTRQAVVSRIGCFLFPSPAVHVSLTHGAIYSANIGNVLMDFPSSRSCPFLDWNFVKER